MREGVVPFLLPAPKPGLTTEVMGEEVLGGSREWELST